MTRAHHFMESRHRRWNLGSREHFSIHHASIWRAPTRIAPIVERHRVQREQGRVVGAPSGRGETARRLAENSAKHLERVFEFVAHSALDYLVYVFIPPTLLVDSKADF